GLVLVHLIEPDAIGIIGVLDHVKAETSRLIGRRATGILDYSLDKLVLESCLDLDGCDDHVHSLSFTLLPLAIIGISSTLEPGNAVGWQGIFALAGPLIRRLDPGETALEAGHDVAREQFIAVQCFFARGPVGHRDHEATKPAAELLQTLDTSDAVVWRANEPLIALGHEIDHLIRRDIGRWMSERCPKVLSQLATTAQADIIARLFTTFGEMHGHDQTPVLTAQGFAMLFRGFFPNGPQLF